MHLLLKNCLMVDDSNFRTHKKDIWIEDKKIKDIQDEIPYRSGDMQDLQIIDIKEQYVIPGIIDCHTHLGIIEEATGKIGVDNNEKSDPITPHLRGIDAINPHDIAFLDAIKSGITTVMSGPGSDNAAGGQSAAIKTVGTIIDKMVVKNPVGFKVAFGENPLNTYGIDGKCPVTRMGIVGLIRELFMQAQDYMVQKVKGQVVQRDIRLEAVIPLLKGELPLRAHAHRADDIATAIRIADEFGIRKLVIEHGTEGNLVKDYLHEKNVPVAFGPMLTPRIKMELKRRHYNTALELVEAGVKVALITDHPYNSIDQLRTIAALAVAEGLKPQDALKCITSNPAEILESSDRLGRLSPGFDADMAVFNGNPLDINSKVVMTLIDGAVVYERKA